MSSEIKLTETQQYWLNRIQEADASDLSLASFAKQNNLDTKPLYNYRSYFRKIGVLDKREAPRFLKVEPAIESGKKLLITIRFPSGIEVLVENPSDTTRLLQQVQSL